jgi:predicted lactoylglutathione lyase
MSKSIVISLPVTDLAVSVAFHEAIGFTRDAQFGSEMTACMVWSETIRFKLLTTAKWRTMTTRPIPPKNSTGVMVALSCDSRGAVDAMSNAAGAHGGAVDTNPVEDHGFMYGRDFADPDGHAIGAMWMDMSGMPAGGMRRAPVAS